MKKLLTIAVLMFACFMNVTACGNKESHHTNTEIEHKPVIVKYDNTNTKSKLRCYEGGYCQQCWYEFSAHKFQCSPKYYVSESGYKNRSKFYKNKCSGNDCKTCWKARNRKWTCKNYHPWY